MTEATLTPQPVTAERFQKLAAKWKEERGPTSSVTAMAMQPAFQEIIGMGPGAIPFLLNELENDPDHLFWALKCITGVDPVAENQRGNLAAMTEAWLNWGRQQGYQW